MGPPTLRHPLALFALCVALGLAIALPIAVLDLHERRRPAAGGAGPPTGPSLLDALAELTGSGAGGPAVDRLAQRTSLRDKVAQLMLVGFAGTGGDAPITRTLRARRWGGVLLQGANALSPAQVRALVASLQAAARRGGALPLLVAARQQGGARSVLPALPPRPQPAIAPRGPRAIGRDAQAAGRSLRRLGVAMTLAPLADVATEGGIFEDRAYGIDEAYVARAVSAAVDGYLRARVIPAVGSFPGAGGAAQDPDLGPAPVSLSLPELAARDLVPFRAIAGRAPVIVLSNATYVAFDGVTPASVLPAAVRLLRDRLGFDGVVATGDLVATTATTGGSVARAAVAALKAGADLLTIPGSAADQQAALRAIVSEVRTGAIAEARVDAAFRRVVILKRAFGIVP